MRRMLTGFVCGWLVLLLLLGCTACGLDSARLPPSRATQTAQPGKAPVTLTVWYWSILRPDLGTDLYEGIVDDWNESRTDIRIEATAFDIEEYRSKIKTSLAAGEAPDLFYMWSGSFVRPYIRTGNMLPLDAFLSDEVRLRIKPEMLAQFIDGDKTYSLPISTYIANLYCNTALFTQAGAVVPKTYDELLAAVKALRAEGITPVALGEKDRWPGMYWYNILAMRMAGVKGARNALQYPALFERDEYRKAAEMLLELNRNGAFSEDAFSMGYVDMVESFRKGEAAMMYQGDFVANMIEAEDSPVKDTIVVVPFPVVPGGNGSAYEFLGGNQDSFYVRADTPHPREAVKVLLYISERAGREVEASGMGNSSWKAEPGTVSAAPPVLAQSIALMETGLDFLGWWDTILPASSADTHKELVADLLDNRLTPEEFTAEMAKLIGAQP